MLTIIIGTAVALYILAIVAEVVRAHDASIVYKRERMKRAVRAGK